MKKVFFKAFAFLLCLSSLSFCGCSKSGTKNLDLSFYLSSTVTGKYFSSEKNAKTFDTSAIYSNKLDYQLVDEYYSISFNTNKSYMYKMYIDYIEMTVYTNQTLDSQMDITLTISNLADKDNLRDYGEFKTEISLYPKQNNHKTIKVNVKKIVAIASSSKITFDLSSSSEVILEKNGEPNEFKWFIYGLKIYGENVVYN